MGPRSRYLGPEVPQEEFLWQDPIPAVDHELIDEQDIAALKAKILASGLSVSQLVSNGLGVGVNVPLLRYARWSERGAHSSRAAEGLGSQPARAVGNGAANPEGIQQEFNSSQSGGKRVSIADLIVLGGCAGIEQAAKNAGHDVTVPFKPGRTDALQEKNGCRVLRGA
jgi:catalase-peroxidase